MCVEKKCVISESTSHYSVDVSIGDNLGFDQFLSVHYKVNMEKIDIADTFKLRMDIKKGDKIVATYTLVFNYDPEKVDSLI